MDHRTSLAELDKLRTRIQGLRAKTTDNGCTEEEALSAAAKVAELLDRHDLSLSDVEMQEAPCEQLVYETKRKKRIPLENCIGAVAHFCDCRVWREKSATGEAKYVFFGLRSDVTAALYITDLIDNAVRFETGRYKTTPEYGRFPHKERHLANASFAFGMVASIADRLEAMKEVRDTANHRTGRDLVVVKTAIVDTELAKLNLNLRTQRRASRTVSMDAYEAGSAAGDAVAINPGIAETAPPDGARRRS